MYPVCTTRHSFLIIIFSNVVSALGEYYYHYNSFYGYIYSSIAGTIVGSATGCIVFTAIMVGIISCISYIKQRYRRTMTTFNIVESASSTALRLHKRQSPQPKPAYNKYLPYQQPGLHRQLTTLTVVPSTAAYCYYTYYHLYLYFVSYLVVKDMVGNVIGTICGLVLLAVMVVFLWSQNKSQGVRDTIVRQRRT